MSCRTLALASLALLALLAPLGPRARADVIVVDPGGGPGGAALLQAAIDSARDGDLLLLRPGDYGSSPGEWPVVLHKSLALVVDGPAHSVVLSGLEMKLSAPEGGAIFLRGLDVEARPGEGPAGGAAALTLSTGTMWVEDCALSGSLVPTTPGGEPLVATAGLSINAGQSVVVVVRCSLKGSDGADEVPDVSFAQHGGNGLQLGGGVSSVHDCRALGGQGGDGSAGGAGAVAPGGAGMQAVGNYVFVLGGSFRGGDEGADNSAATMPGSGLLALFSSVELRDATIGAGSVQGDGTPAPDVALGVSTLVEYPAAARGIAAPSPLREKEAGVLHATGEVGDVVLLFASLAQGSVSVPAAQGNYVLGAPLLSPIALGPITSPAGSLDIPFRAPLLPAGLDHLVIYLQGVMLPSAGGMVVGSGSALVTIDDSL